MLMLGQPRFARPPLMIARWVKAVPGATLSALDLDTVKDFIQRPREDTFWDVEITNFMRVAQAEIERVCQMSLTPTTWVGYFPTQAFSYDQIHLIKRPFIDITKVEYVAPTTGTITQVDSATYQSMPVSQMCGMAMLGEGCSWPTPAMRMDAVRVTCRTGFAEMPPEITHALLLTLAAIDSQRGDSGGGGGGSSVTVYAMKMASGGGGSFLPREARGLLSDYIYRSI